MESMKAITRQTYGTPDVLVLSEIEKPKPTPDEVLVRVHATTVNRTDCSILTGKPAVIRLFTGLRRPKLKTPGVDFAGRVEAVGKGVSDFKTGDSVWGLDDNGLSSQAQYLSISHKGNIILMPEDISYFDIIACAEGAHYALNFINKVSMREGDKVLVNGATGAIGTAAVQLLKHLGAYVTAVVNTKNMALAYSLGADKVVDWQKEDFLADSQRYDFVFDATGKSRFKDCRHLLKPRGVYLSSELGPGGENIYLPLITKIKGGKRVKFPVPSNCKRSLIFVKSLIEKGAFKPVIDRSYPMEKIAVAYRYVMTGQKTGSVVVSYK